MGGGESAVLFETPLALLQFYTCCSTFQHVGNMMARVVISPPCPVDAKNNSFKEHILCRG
jgi:hypothetical protein